MCTTAAFPSAVSPFILAASPISQLFPSSPFRGQFSPLQQSAIPFAFAALALDSRGQRDLITCFHVAGPAVTPTAAFVSVVTPLNFTSLRHRFPLLCWLLLLSRDWLQKTTAHLFCPIELRQRLLAELCLLRF